MKEKVGQKNVAAPTKWAVAPASRPVTKYSALLWKTQHYHREADSKTALCEKFFLPLFLSRKRGKKGD
ncbi:MAG: hypothetical protein K2P26_04930 [Oscillospiraceae bacterium]|nr:hypothetical protein [Oscillospiraceae bacterium]